MAKRTQIECSPASRSTVAVVAATKGILRPAAADLLILTGYETLMNSSKQRGKPRR